MHERRLGLRVRPSVSRRAARRGDVGGGQVDAAAHSVSRKATEPTIIRRGGM
jgi:hypothetical protein